MTDNELIREAREFAGRVPLGRPLARELDKAIGMIRRLADALEAATTEPDWEYAVESTKTGNRWPCEDAHEAQEAAGDGFRILRRRKAGPWIPVEGEGSDEA